MAPFKVFIAALLLITGVDAARAQALVGRTFHPNGRLESTRYSDGEVEHFIQYYADGRVQAMGSYRDGRRDGVWRQFDRNGAVLAEARFLNGKRTGTWEFRNARNEVTGRLHYADGHLASGEAFDASGLLAQRDY